MRPAHWAVAHARLLQDRGCFLSPLIRGSEGRLGYWVRNYFCVCLPQLPFDLKVHIKAGGRLYASHERAVVAIAAVWPASWRNCGQSAADSSGKATPRIATVSNGHRFMLVSPADGMAVHVIEPLILSKEMKACLGSEAPQD